jgi:hypothetical protein
MTIMAPSGGPLKSADLQVKIPWGSGVGALLGAAMDSSLIFALTSREKYCHNGGMAIAHHHGGDSGEEGAD